MNLRVSFVHILSLSIFSILAFNASAQTWEVGGFVGGAGYMGDLNPENPTKVNNLVFGGQIKRNFNAYWSAKLNVMSGQIEAKDSESSSAQFKRRNLSFFTPLTEISVQTEFNLFKFIPTVTNRRYSPFLFAGLGLVSFNPKTTLDGQVYELNTYGTEGQDYFAPYNTYAIAVPYGAGVKFNFAGKWNLITEIGFRTAYTDYLDDVSGIYPTDAQLEKNTEPSVAAIRKRLADRSEGFKNEPLSQRGDFRKHDTYMFTGISITYTFFSKRCPVVE